jgi:putative phosphoribosyl transferase
MFSDRADAGVQLAHALERYRGAADAVVLAIPRGGVVVAAEVARILGLPMDIVVVRKIGAPGNPEYAVGAMDEDGRVLRNPSAYVSDAYLAKEGRVNLAEIERRVAEYRGGRPAPELGGRTAILVDDGIATGLTALAAIAFARSHGAARVVLATPVVARDTAPRLAAAADELVAVDTPPVFRAVGESFGRFGQTSDAEVRALMAEAAAREE